MRLSTRGRYGLRAMIDMAQNLATGPVVARNIAERQGISERYLEQLMVPLKRAGLVKSIRGSHGGYVLGGDPEKITAGDIIRVLEGPIAPVECVAETDPESCRRQEHCITRVLWTQVRNAIALVLDSYSLADLAREAQNGNAEGAIGGDL